MKAEEQGLAVKEKESARERERAELREGDLPEEEERRLLEKTWGDKPGLWGWLTSTNHKSIGKRFIITAFIFFALGGVLAVLMRIQLSRPENTFLSTDAYNQIFTMHGTTMMFLFAIPVMEAFGIYLVPLMVGTRNVAFPRLQLLDLLVRRHHALRLLHSEHWAGHGLVQLRSARRAGVLSGQAR